MCLILILFIFQPPFWTNLYIQNGLRMGQQITCLISSFIGIPSSKDVPVHGNRPYFPPKFSFQRIQDSWKHGKSEKHLCAFYASSMEKSTLLIHPPGHQFQVCSRFCLAISPLASVPNLSPWRGLILRQCIIPFLVFILLRDHWQSRFF